MTGLESIPGWFSLMICLEAQKWGLTPLPCTAARPLTSDEGALLPGLLQQQYMLQQRGVPMGACVTFQGHAQQAAGDRGCAHELASQCATLPQGLKGLPLGLLLC